MKQTDKEKKENNDFGKILLLSLKRGEVVKEMQSSPEPEDIREEKEEEDKEIWEGKIKKQRKEKKKNAPMFAGPGMYSTLNECIEEQAENSRKQKGKNKPKGLNNANQTARVRPRIYHGHFLIQHPNDASADSKSKKKSIRQQERQECNNKNAIPSWPCRRKESVVILSKPLKPIARMSRKQ